MCLTLCPFGFGLTCCKQERCTKLERALQAAKSETAASSQAAATSAAEVEALQQQLLQSQQLVKQLEADLVALSSRSSGAIGVLPGAALGLSMHGGVTDSLTGLEDLALAPSAAGVDAAAAAGCGSAAAAEGASASGGDAAVLQAVTGQRDRFKARIGELEAEQAQMTTRLQQAAAQVDTVTKDNVALVEKIRWVVGQAGRQEGGADGGQSGRQAGRQAYPKAQKGRSRGTVRERTGCGTQAATHNMKDT